MAKNRLKTAVITVTVLALSVGMSACSANNSTENNATNESASKEVILVTHESFKLPKETIAKFEKNSGLKLKQVQAGSGPELVNKLKMTKNKPIGDVVYGLATNDLGAVVKDALLQPSSVKLPEGANKYVDLEAPNAVPMDHGDICVNIDTTYFKDKDIATPVTLNDLTKPAYKGLFVTINPTDNVTGFGFLAATIKQFGAQGWQAYWKALKENNVKIDKGWSEAYEQDFTQGGKDGKYPIALSYEGSPAYTINKDKTASTTKILPDTCYENVEYAGVLTNAKNKENAEKLLQWLLSDEVQSQIPDNMYMYPVSAKAKLPEEYQKFAPASTKHLKLSGAELLNNKEKWLKEWTDTIK